jgi:Zn-dependent protease
MLIFLPIVFFALLEFGAVSVVLLLLGVIASILLHELGHCFVALRTGCRVREILLMPIGGVAQMEQIPRRPRDEFLMAIGGPVVSVVLAVLGISLGVALARFGLAPMGPDNVLFALGVINCGLVLFNMLPAFPMDGGRVLRALLSTRIGRLRATAIAAKLGKIFAIGFGLYALFSESVQTGQGVALLVIAFFIYRAADYEYRIVQYQETFQPFAYDFFWPPERPPDSGSQGGDVVVGPPPYRKGPDERTSIRPM